MIKENIGNRIKAVRIKLNMTQKDFCKIFNITQSHIAKIENGTLAPNLDFILQLNLKPLVLFQIL